ncbi:TRAP transporter substrate-binding protein DctP [Chloroflexota bacterium]
MQQIKWHASTWGSPRAWTEPIEYWINEVESRSGGRIKITLHYGEELAPKKETLDALAAGAFEMGGVVSAFVPGKIRLHTVFDLPGMPPPIIRHQAEAIIALCEHPAVAKELAERGNAKFLLPAASGTQEIMGKKQIASITDFQGVKVRASGGLAKVMESVGAVPVMMGGPEMFDYLDKGLVDIIVTAWTFGFHSYGLYEASEYATTGFAMTSLLGMWPVNLQAWEALPPDIQKIMLDVREELPAKFDEALQPDEKHLKAFSDAGIEIIQFPTAERAKLIEKAEATWDEWAAEKNAEGLPGTEILEFLKAEKLKLK